MTSPAEEKFERAQLLLARIAAAGVVLVFAVIVTSAYLRLVQIGLGCADWPDCYGARVTRSVPSGRAAEEPAAFKWVRATHRLAASAVAVLVLFAGVLAVSGRRRTRGALVASGVLAALTLFLAVLGLATPGSQLPAVTLGNLTGGMAMLALFWWLWLQGRVAPGSSRTAPAWIAAAALVLLAVQIALGALVSSNLASRACASLADCRAAWWPWDWDLAAFNPWRDVGLPAPADIARRTLNMAHRWGALLVTGLCAGLVVALLRRGDTHRRLALVLAVLLVTEIALGTALAWLDLPLAVALAHNAVASLLLVTAVSAAFYWRRSAEVRNTLEPHSP